MLCHRQQLVSKLTLLANKLTQTYVIKARNVKTVVIKCVGDKGKSVTLVIRFKAIVSAAVEVEEEVEEEEGRPAR